MCTVPTHLHFFKSPCSTEAHCWFQRLRSLNIKPRLSQRSTLKSNSRTNTYTKQLQPKLHTDSDKDDTLLHDMSCHSQTRTHTHAYSKYTNFPHGHTSSLLHQTPYKRLNGLKGFCVSSTVQPCDLVLTAEPVHQVHIELV